MKVIVDPVSKVLALPASADFFKANRPLAVAPVGSVVIILGDSYSAGYPVNTVGGTNGAANGYTGPGYCYPQWISALPFFKDIPVYSYGLAGSVATSAAGVLSGSGTVLGTKYVNGLVVGSYGGVTALPSTLVPSSATGIAYFVTEYGVNDIGGSVTFATWLSTMRAVWTTIHGYGSNVRVIAVTVPETTSSPNIRRAPYNAGLVAQITGLTNGIDSYAHVGAFFNNSNNAVYFDALHLNSIGYQIYANVIALAIINSGNQNSTLDPINYGVNHYLTGCLNFGQNTGGQGTAPGAGLGTVYYFLDGNQMERICNDGTGLNITTFDGGGLINFGCVAQSDGVTFTLYGKFDASGNLVLQNNLIMGVSGGTLSAINGTSTVAVATDGDGSNITVAGNALSQIYDGSANLQLSNIQWGDGSGISGSQLADSSSGSLSVDWSLRQVYALNGTVIFGWATLAAFKASVIASNFTSDTNHFLDGTGAFQAKSIFQTASAKLTAIAAATPIADGTYTVGLGVTTNGTISTVGGIITAVQQAS